MKYRLYHGSSEFLSLDEAHFFLNQIQKEDSTIELITINGDNTDPQTIIDQISSQNLFSPKRLFFLKRVYKNKNKDKFLDDLLNQIKEDGSDDTIIFWEDSKIKSNTKYYKFFKDRKAVFEKETLNKRTFFSWLKEECKRNELEIDSTALKLLAEKTNYDPERCSNEIKKLRILGKAIKKKDIEDLVTDTLEKDIWNLIDAINIQEKEKSIEILEKLKNQRVDPNYTISMLARNLRLITLTKYLYEQGNNYKGVASTLRIPPFTVPSLIKASKLYSEERISKLYTKLANLDFQIKKGLIDADLGLTLITPYL